MKILDFSIGGAIGLFAGILLAEYVGATTASAYALLVALSIIFFSLLGKVVSAVWRRARGKPGRSGPKESDG